MGGAVRPVLGGALRPARSLAVASVVDGAIEHIGSTAVPGLAAKPTVDVMLGVRPGALDAVVAPLVAAG